MISIVKDPADVLYFKMDASNWLDPGELITSQAIGDAVGLTVEEKAISDGNTSVVAKLSGGTGTEVYSVPYIWSTDGGRTKKVTLVVRMRSN